MKPTPTAEQAKATDSVEAAKHVISQLAQLKAQNQVLRDALRQIDAKMQTGCFNRRMKNCLDMQEAGEIARAALATP